MIWQLVVLGAALGLNNSLASVALGTMKIPRRQQWVTAILFGLFEAGMPVLGMVVGQDLSAVIGGNAKYIGIGILALVGLYSLLKRDDDTGEVAHGLGWKTLVLAAALSLDNLTVGFALGMIELPIAVAALIFGIVSLVMTLIGLEIGRFIGSRVHVNADKLSGVVLLLTAVVMVIH